MLARAVLFASLLFTSPAIAFDTSQLGQGGSLHLSDLIPLLDKTPKLKSEVGQALAEVKKTHDAVICAGQRFPGQWVELGGKRVSPYNCLFADDKWLQIRASVRITDKNRRAFEKATPTAMKSAVTVSETNLTWKWTAKAPDE
jgi:hypothetical protein